MLFILKPSDSMFASASLDGAIVLWSSHSLTCTKQFNFVKNYEGLNHMYPNSIQSAFTVEQVKYNRDTFYLWWNILNHIYPDSI